MKTATLVWDHSYFKEPKVPKFNEHSYGATPTNTPIFRPFDGRGGLFKLDQQAAERKNIFNSKMKKINLQDFKCRNCSEVCFGEERARKHCNRKKCPNVKLDEVKCTTCYQVFASKEKLNYHKRMAHGEVMQCHVCGVNCKGRRNLATHMAREHGKMDECSTCGKTFTTRHSWLNHVKRHRGLLKKYFCPHCYYRCERTWDMSKHIKRKHSIEEKSGEDKDPEERVQEERTQDCKYQEHMGQGDQGEDIIPTPPSAKRRKIVMLSCKSGEQTVERILYISGKNLSQLKLPDSETDDDGKRKNWKVKEVGKGEMDFEVISATGSEDTAVLAGNKQVATVRLSTSGAHIQSYTTKDLVGSPILQTELARIGKNFYWLVGTSKKVQMFLLEEEELALALVTTIKVSDLLSFTVDRSGDQLFILESSGVVKSATKLSTLDVSEGADPLVQAAEGSFSSIFFCSCHERLYLVEKESTDIYRGTVKEGGLVDVMTKV